MPDIDAIRRGLAANLRAVPDCNVSPYLFPDEKLVAPALQVAGLEALDYVESFGQTGRLNIVVEGVTSAASSRAGQVLFDTWLLWTVPEAIEADTQLTSRLQDSGSILTDQDPACDSLHVREFRGYRKTRLASGTEVFLGDWLIELLASG